MPWNGQAEAMLLSPSASLEPFGFFVARLPLLPAVSGFGGPPEAILDDAIIREALTHASPSLIDQATRPDRTVEKARPALARYLARMRGRSTPFGLLTAYAHGGVGGDATEVRLEPTRSSTRVIRLATACVSRIVDKWSRETADRTGVRWRARRDLFVLTDIIRMCVPGQRGLSDLQESDVARTAPLDLVLRTAAQPVSIATLVDALRPHAPSEDAAIRYVEHLIALGFLLSEHHPPVATDDELGALEFIGTDLFAAARSIRTTPFTMPIAEQVAALKERVTPNGEPPDTSDFIFDVVRPLQSGMLGGDLLTALVELVGVLQRVAFVPMDLRLEEFAQSFVERYEHREIPLVEALDSHRGLIFPVGMRPTRPDAAFSDWLLSLFERSARENVTELVLRPQDIPARVLWRPQEAVAIAFSLARDPLSVHEPRVEGSPGTALFARATSFIPQLRDLTRASLRHAFPATSERTFVELVPQLPGSFAAFGQVPRLMSHELTLSAVSGDGETSCSINDIVVSVRSGRIVLRSAITGTEIVPRVTSAANLDRADNTNAGRFLAALARDHQSFAAWSWHAFQKAAFCPRVRYKDHVLSPARWFLGAQRTEALRAARTLTDRIEAVSQLREDLGLPRHIVYRQRHDHALPVDLDDIWNVTGWLDIAEPEMILSEHFPSERSAVVGPDGPYHHELVVPFTVSTTRTEPAPSTFRPYVSRHDVVFDRVLPGRDVLFATWSGDDDELLPIMLDVYDEVICPLRAESTLRYWFFLPYSNPRPHVRLRLFGAREALYGLGLERLHRCLDPLARNRIIDGFAIDTYDRETYRYGGPHGVELCERIFCVSSDYAVEFHRGPTGADPDPETLLPPLVHSHRAILECAGLPLERRRSVAARAAAWRSNFPRRDPRDRTPVTPGQRLAPKHRAGMLYRKLCRSLQDAAMPRNELGPHRMSVLRELFTQLRGAAESETLTRPLDDLLVDLLHVHSVRLLTTWGREPDWEEIAYHLAARSLVTQGFMCPADPL